MAVACPLTQSMIERTNLPWVSYLPRLLQKRVEGRIGLQRMLSNSGWLLADRVFRALVGLTVGVWIARYLGPARFGLYSYAIAFVSLFSSIATLGLDRVVVRDLTRATAGHDEILGTAFGLKLVGGGFALILAVTGAFLVRPEDTEVHWLVVLVAAGMIFQAFDAIDFWFQSRTQSRFAIYAKTTAFTLLSMAKIGLVVVGAPLIAFAGAGLAEVILGAVGLVVAYRVSGLNVARWRFRAVIAQSLMRDCWPVMLSGIAIYAQARIDQIMLGDMIGDAEVGQFSVALRLIEACAFVPVIIQMSVAPAVTRAKIEGDRAYESALLNVYRLMFIVFVVTALPVFLFAHDIVSLLFGPAYRPAGSLLALFAFRLIFTNFGLAKGLFITNESLFKYSLYAAVLGSFTNVALNYLLIPRYASVGAIAATMASFFVTTFLLDAFFVRMRGNLLLMLRAMCSPWRLTLRASA